MFFNAKKQPITLNTTENSTAVTLTGTWNLADIPYLSKVLKKIRWPKDKAVIFNGADIITMDTSGAWELYKLQKKLQQQGYEITFEHLTPEHQKLLDLVEQQAAELQPVPPVTHEDGIERLGRKTVTGIYEALSYISFVGENAIVAIRSLQHLERIRWKPIFHAIEVSGWQALPIIALLSFMIGVVLAYQMGLQLKNYGANIYVVDLVGIAMLREFSSLVTAIMVAGRTGSAFTAQIGTMVLNEEIDALYTMGLHPMELLILPRIIGLVIALPLLTIWSDVFGVLGGMVMAKSMFNIGFIEFLERFRAQVDVNALLIGLCKAPVFALIIASIGCYQGMQVRGSAESVGQRTTQSVVHAIFAIIVADALFSIIFSQFNL